MWGGIYQDGELYIIFHVILTTFAKFIHIKHDKVYPHKNSLYSRGVRGSQRIDNELWNNVRNVNHIVKVNLTIFLKEGIHSHQIKD